MKVNIFSDLVSTFLNRYQTDLERGDQQKIEANINTFHTMYEQVMAQGGFIRVYSEQGRFLDGFDKRMVKLYKKYFLSFEYYQRKKLVSWMKVEYLEKARHLTVEEYSRSGQLNIHLNQINVIHMDSVLSEKLNQQFSLDHLLKQHREQRVDIRVQSHSDLSSKDRIPQQKLELTIEQYLEYQRDQAAYVKSLIQKGHTYLNSDSILFAVNVDMDTWPSEANTLRELFPEISFGSKYDGLSYLRQHTLGVSMPQVYIKVADVYTGGHQEHLSVNAVNINNGPGSSVWISVDAKHVARVRELIKAESEIDIMLDEGLWFREAEYFIQHQIPVKYTVQRAGDVIVLGPGCLHLVKSEGIAVQTAWNYMPKELEVAEAMYDRYLLNRQVNYQTVIPIGTLFLDLLNHEKATLPLPMVKFLQRTLNTLYEEEKQWVSRTLEVHRDRVRYVEYREDSYQVTLCSGCWHEILMYFYMVEGTRQGGQFDFYCVRCMNEQIEQLHHRTGLVYHKYKVACFLDQLSERLSPTCAEPLCFSNYIGGVQCNRMFQKTHLMSTRSLDKPRRSPSKLKSELTPKKELKKEPEEDQIHISLESDSAAKRQVLIRAVPIRKASSRGRGGGTARRPRGGGRPRKLQQTRVIEEDIEIQQDVEPIPIKKRAKDDLYTPEVPVDY